MVIDLDKCTGCGSCMVACMAENNVPFKKDETNKRDSITWMKVYQLTNGQPFPDNDICYLPRPCMHCEGQSRSFPLRFSLPGHGHGLQHRDGYRQPDLHPMLRVSVLHGSLSLSCPLLQLVGSGLASGNGRDAQPGRFGPDAWHRRKMQLLFPSLPGRHGQSASGGPHVSWKKVSTRPPAPRHALRVPLPLVI